jgi:hypothetical protein
LPALVVLPDSFTSSRSMICPFWSVTKLALRGWPSAMLAWVIWPELS